MSARACVLGRACCKLSMWRRHIFQILLWSSEIDLHASTNSDLTVRSPLNGIQEPPWGMVKTEIRIHTALLAHTLRSPPRPEPTLLLTVGQPSRTSSPPLGPCPPLKLPSLKLALGSPVGSPWVRPSACHGFARRLALGSPVGLPWVRRWLALGPPLACPGFARRFVLGSLALGSLL